MIKNGLNNFTSRRILKSQCFVNILNFQLWKKFCSKTYKELKELPYLFGGMKFLNSYSTNPFKSFEEFDERKFLELNRNVKKELYDVDESDDETSDYKFHTNISKSSSDSLPKIYFNKNLISALRFNLSYSNKFYTAISEMYFQYTNNLVQIFNCKFLNQDQNKEAKATLRKLLNDNFYKRLLYEENSFLIKRKEKFKNLQNINENGNILKLHKDNINKNKFYLDKIFLHCNWDKNYSENLYLDKIENIYNKNLIIFNYKKKNNEDGKEDKEFSNFLSNFKFDSFLLNENYQKKNLNKKLLVRFSVWCKMSDNLITEYTEDKETVHKYRIYDDEWHHILFEMEDDLNELKYLNVLSNFSFPKLVSKLIIGTKKVSNEINYKDDLKIADFDFYMKGNPISRKNGILKDEFYFIKRRI